MRRVGFDLLVYGRRRRFQGGGGGGRKDEAIAFVRHIANRTAYAQDQVDRAIPAALRMVDRQIDTWSKRVWNPAFPDARRRLDDLLARQERLFNTLDELSDELEYGSAAISYVTDASLAEAQRHVRADNAETARLRARFDAAMRAWLGATTRRIRRRATTTSTTTTTTDERGAQGTYLV